MWVCVYIYIYIYIYTDTHMFITFSGKCSILVHVREKPGYACLHYIMP